jgi:hypothetical protein
MRWGRFCRTCTPDWEVVPFRELHGVAPTIEEELARHRPARHRSARGTMGKCSACRAIVDVRTYAVSIDGELLRMQPRLCGSCGDSLVLRWGHVLGALLRPLDAGDADGLPGPLEIADAQQLFERLARWMQGHPVQPMLPVINALAASLARRSGVGERQAVEMFVLAFNAEPFGAVRVREGGSA